MDEAAAKLIEKLTLLEAISSGSTTANSLRHINSLVNECLNLGFDVGGKIDSLSLALTMADETFRDLGWHDKWELTSAALDANRGHNEQV